MDDQPEIIPQQNVNQVEVGDIRLLSTTASITELTDTAKTILKNKQLSNYLNTQLPHKKFLGL